jgi:hypothetical protein
MKMLLRFTTLVTVKTSMSFSGIKFAPSGVDWLLEIYHMKFSIEKSEADYIGNNYNFLFLMFF